MNYWSILWLQLVEIYSLIFALVLILSKSTVAHIHAPASVHVRSPHGALLLTGPALLRVTRELHDRAAFPFLERGLFELFERLERQVAHLEPSELLYEVVERHPANRARVRSFQNTAHTSTVLWFIRDCMSSCEVRVPELAIIVRSAEVHCITFLSSHELPFLWVVRPRPWTGYNDKQTLCWILNVWS